MTNREIITGNDYRRMITGAYSNFLLEYENINQLDATSLLDTQYAGNNFLHTMSAAAGGLRDSQLKGIGAVSHIVSNCAILGARGNAGVLLAQIFRGLAKGLVGKYDVTSSELGKAFQYGILYAQRTANDNGERPIIVIAKKVAKGAHQAVRENRPITEILSAAIEAGEKAISENSSNKHDAGAKALLVLLKGCRSGLDGNFVSPTLMFTNGSNVNHTIPNPDEDIVNPYCLEIKISHARMPVEAMKKTLERYGNMVVIRKKMYEVFIHLHTECPSNIIEQVLGWGSTYSIHIDNMAEAHDIRIVLGTLHKTVVLATAEQGEAADSLQKKNATVLLDEGSQNSFAVGKLVNLVHSDMAEKYILLPHTTAIHLVAEQAKKLLGKRLAVIYTSSLAEQLAVLEGYKEKAHLTDNLQKMNNILFKLRKK